MRTQGSQEPVCPSPYIFVIDSRLNHVLMKRAQGTWKPDADLVNNVLTRLKALCRRASVAEFTLHDLRRS
jgi:hypothetical protein